MHALSLRLRVFLFFCLIVGGSILALGVGILLGVRQLGDPQALSAFVTAGVVSGFGLTGVALFVWLLFDENVSKPIEALSAQMRLGAEHDAKRDIDTTPARYLGDLAPAAKAVHDKLSAEQGTTQHLIAERTQRLKTQRAQLLRILSDIPVAVIVASADHQIVLYDGQAAELMERECHARLNGSVFDYLDKTEICRLLDEMAQSGTKRRAISLLGRSGNPFTGHLRRFDDGLGYTLMLEPLSPDAARPLVYDFDLLERQTDAAFDDTALKNLSFVVFDSETTGLDPDQDSVVQLGAVRVVNGKIVDGEVFDALVNPGRAIPAASSRVHGISDAMVADAPAFSHVCAQFHKFAAGSVLVAHNAPFDMAFLRAQSHTDAYSFDNPVLDTVHMSAVVFGGAAEHTLDALCDRLGVTIPYDVRHTGLGDALATAQALCGLIPILEARGITTFGHVRAEARKHQRILKIEE